MFDVPTDFQVRALECGSSVCALEIVSTSGGLRAKSLRPLKEHLLLVDILNGYEGGAGSRVLTVTSMTFQRTGAQAPPGAAPAPVENSTVSSRPVNRTLD
jgi:hypothetical protein